MDGLSIFLIDIFSKKKKQPQQIVGLKFFNVYGPNEIHKGKMRSIALKIHQTITKRHGCKSF